MPERIEDWNVGLAQDLQDDEFVRAFVAASDRLRAEVRIHILNDLDRSADSILRAVRA